MIDGRIRAALYVVAGLGCAALTVGWRQAQADPIAAHIVRSAAAGLALIVCAGAVLAAGVSVPLRYLQRRGGER